MRIQESAIWKSYLEATPGSRRAYEEAVRFLPGGNTRATLFYPPYPVYIERGEGSHTFDVDGREIVDFLNNYTSLLLGHANPRVTAAVQEVLPRGTAYAAPTTLEVKLASMIAERLPSVERVIFTNSGSEGVMGALRAARGFTGRSMIAKFEGGYHGGIDEACVSGKTPLDQVGDPTVPNRVFDNGGISPRVLEDVAVMRFNDPVSVETVVGRYKDQLAAIIVEPLMNAGGTVPPAPGFLELLRDITRRHGILLVFDEVVTFRMGPGAGQGYYGVTPDLTAMGKVIGGGLPVGGFGGRADVMDVHDPSRGHPVVTHLGTYNANPLTMAAGIATLEQLTPEAFGHLAKLGAECRRKLTEVLRSKGLSGRADGDASFAAIRLPAGVVTDYRSARACTPPQVMQLIHLGLMTEGVAMASRGMACLSVPMTSEDVDTFARALSRVLDVLLAEGWLEQYALDSRSGAGG